MSDFWDGFCNTFANLCPNAEELGEGIATIIIAFGLVAFVVIVTLIISVIAKKLSGKGIN